MQKLAFPDYSFNLQATDEGARIFDPVRKKFVALTPEEWVRQHVIRVLSQEKGIPLSLMKVEAEIRLFRTRKRFDAAVFDRNGNALLVVECKAPSVPLGQEVLDQAVRYNMTLRVKYLVLTNGLRHLFCQVDPDDGKISMIDDLPDFTLMTGK